MPAGTGRVPASGRCGALGAVYPWTFFTRALRASLFFILVLDLKLGEAFILQRREQHPMNRDPQRRDPGRRFPWASERLRVLVPESENKGSGAVRLSASGEDKLAALMQREADELGGGGDDDRKDKLSKAGVDLDSISSLLNGKKGGGKPQQQQQQKKQKKKKKGGGVNQQPQKQEDVTAFLAADDAREAGVAAAAYAAAAAASAPVPVSLSDVAESHEFEVAESESEAFSSEEVEGGEGDLVNGKPFSGDAHEMEDGDAAMMEEEVYEAGEEEYAEGSEGEYADGSEGEYEEGGEGEYEEGAEGEGQDGELWTDPETGQTWRYVAEDGGYWEEAADAGSEGGGEEEWEEGGEWAEEESASPSLPVQAEATEPEKDPAGPYSSGAKRLGPRGAAGQFPPPPQPSGRHANYQYQQARPGAAYPSPYSPYGSTAQQAQPSYGQSAYPQYPPTNPYGYGSQTASPYYGAYAAGWSGYPTGSYQQGGQTSYYQQQVNFEQQQQQQGGAQGDPNGGQSQQSPQQQQQQMNQYPYPYSNNPYGRQLQNPYANNPYAPQQGQGGVWNPYAANAGLVNPYARVSAYASPYLAAPPHPQVSPNNPYAYHQQQTAANPYGYPGMQSPPSGSGGWHTGVQQDGGEKEDMFSGYMADERMKKRLAAKKGVGGGMAAEGEEQEDAFADFFGGVGDDDEDVMETRMPIRQGMSEGSSAIAAEKRKLTEIGKIVSDTEYEMRKMDEEKMGAMARKTKPKSNMASLNRLGLGGAGQKGGKAMDQDAIVLSLRDVAMSFDKQEVIKKATFDVRAGDVCGLVGPNGCGKSTILRLVKGDIEPDKGTITAFNPGGQGLAPKVALLRQEFVEELDLERTLSEELRTVFGPAFEAMEKMEVLASKVEEAQKEIAIAKKDGSIGLLQAEQREEMEEAMMPGGSKMGRKAKRQQEKKKKKDKKKKKKKGKKGEEEEDEDEEEEFEETMEGGGPSSAGAAGGESSSDKTAHKNPLTRLDALMSEMTQAQTVIDQYDAYTIDSRIERITNLVGFTEQDLALKVSAFSGGWKMRIGLAKLLLQEPTLLLLDEPTNHLDLDSVEWVEDFLNKIDLPVLVVSHDREFLDRVTNRIVDCDGGVCQSYEGNYSSFLQQRKQKLRDWRKAWEQQNKEEQSLKDFIRENEKKGHMSSAVNQKRIQLERMQNSNDYILEPPREAKGFKFEFPLFAEPPPGAVIEISGLTHGYPMRVPKKTNPLHVQEQADGEGKWAETAEGREGAALERGDDDEEMVEKFELLFDDCDLSVERCERVAVLGPNGVGKSTLLRLILGREPPSGLNMGSEENGEGGAEGEGGDAEDEDFLPQDRILNGSPALGGGADFGDDIAETGEESVETYRARTVKNEGGMIKINGRNTRVCYFEQNQADALDLTLTVMETLEEANYKIENPEHRKSPQDLRDLAALFMFKKDDVYKKVQWLSGGEKARLALCRMMLFPCNVLLLDEPTNHLDIPAKEVLEHACQMFRGPVVVVSHDRYFVSQIANTIVSVEDRRLKKFDMDYKAFMLRRGDLKEQVEKRYGEGSDGIQSAPSVLSKEELEKVLFLDRHQKRLRAFGGADAVEGASKTAVKQKREEAAQEERMEKTGL
uniref:ABC transporter domain-containing protein n=1 Tax=Chromera velia CCMP2878 TaxID=1169474 RepID=A0A0G4I980_9ALVE|eukprot:Cvel_12199.t1-p1 / transcript=Cvel_12199.t1 / gene=Cvel_12199 / organism=Chromera_velia_CCMP2878 / gene_product=ABC transporter F family member 5, putative / transcript_product=ABC transporter F family member 5, putative / location=Cvel_scaffold788:58016-65673(-) / protein_length=1615 / sequence_SO=supercontig / SO=protein_coding / is_pseudo=false